MNTPGESEKARRHAEQVLGRFVSWWGEFEGVLLTDIAHMLEIPDATAAIIHAALGTRDRFEMLKELSHNRLDDQASEDFNKLIDRGIALSQKRNKLVHGHWVVSEPNHEHHRYAQELHWGNMAVTLLSDPRSVSFVARNRFSLRQIEELTEKVIELNNEIAGFFPGRPDRKPLPFSHTRPVRPPPK